MPRRVSKKPKASHAPAKTREPLAEGIVPLDKAGRRKWASLSDDELISYAKRNRVIKTRKELERKDGSLYHTLRKRKLLDRLGLADTRGKRRPNGFFTKMDDEKLVDYAKKMIEKMGMKSRSELQKSDSGLYKALRIRKLLDKVFIGKQGRPKRFFTKMSDDELVAFARKFIRENEINGRGKLQKADNGLYNALRIRKLLERVGLENKNVSYRNWSSMSDEEVVSHAKRFIKEKGINERKELQEADHGLYRVLQRRKLQDKVGFEDNLRQWRKMNDEELVSYAKRFMEEKGLSGRKELEKADNGLYCVLRRRKLLDRAFEDIEKTKEREEAQALFDGLAEFGGTG